jgi:hypothetical protein
MLIAVTETAADIEDVLGHTVSTHRADLVVMVTRTEPRRPAWLETIGVPVKYVGDAVLPRSYKTAVREGYIAGTRVEELCTRAALGTR